MSITLAISDLKSKLEAVSADDVRIGRDASTEQIGNLPITTIVSQSESRAPDRDQVYDGVLYRRSVALEFKLDAPQTYHEDIDTALAAFRGVLVSDPDGEWLGGYARAVRERGVNFLNPGAGSNVAGFSMTIEIDYEV